MITIPLYTLLFAYLLFLAIFVAFSIINFYHIITTASFTFASFLVTFVIFALATLTIYFTWQILIDVDWQSAVTIFDPSWITGTFSF